MSDKQEFLARNIPGVDVGEDETMKFFYESLVKCAQVKRTSALSAGSLMEIYGQNMIFPKFHLKQDSLDEDTITFNSNICAFSYRQTLSEQFDGTAVTINSDCLHPGYAKLLHTGTSLELRRCDVASKLFGDFSGPAAKSDTTSHFDHRCREIAKTFSQFSRHMMLVGSHNRSELLDIVVAVHSPFWPLEANEWITRPRLHDSPSKSTIKEVIRNGCDFVQVSHKLSTNKDEWRFSFSKAELIIIYNWTTCQRIVYRSLHLLCKIIKSRMESTVLCTYYLKTMMLWACENKSADFWSEDVLVDSVCDLLCEVSNWLKKKCCPNYFIPSNNMIDHLGDTDLSADTDALCQLLQDSKLLTDVLNMSRHIEICDRNRIYLIEAPMWVYTSLVIFEQIRSTDYKSMKAFSQNFSSLLHYAYCYNISNTFKGLKIVQMAANSIMVSHTRNIVYKACEPLTRSIVLDGVSRSHLVCSREMTLNILPGWFRFYGRGNRSVAEESRPIMICDTIKSVDRLNAFNVDTHERNHMSCLYSQSMDDVVNTVTNDHFNENICTKKEVTTTKCATTNDDRGTYSAIMFFKEVAGFSPTVNIFWFTNEAYLANLYYTTQNDYTATEDVCDGIITVYRQTFFNQKLAEISLPVILSTNWTSVYDEELQVMLGLHSLCRFMFNETDRSRTVCRGVCPPLFALYLKFRGAADQLLLEQMDYHARKFDEHFQHQCFAHPSQCSCNYVIKTACISVVKTVSDLLERI